MKVKLSTFLLMLIILIAVIIALGAYIYNNSSVLNGKGNENELLNKIDIIEQKIDKISNSNNNIDEENSEEVKNTSEYEISGVGLEIKEIEPVISKYFDYIFSIQSDSVDVLSKIDLIDETRNQSDFEKIEIPDKSYDNNHNYLLTNVLYSEFIEKLTSEIMTKECFEKINNGLVTSYDGKICLAPVDGTYMTIKIIAIELINIKENVYSYNVKIQTKSEDHIEWEKEDKKVLKYNVNIKYENGRYIVSDCEESM